MKILTAREKEINKLIESSYKEISGALDYQDLIFLMEITNSKKEFKVNVSFCSKKDFPWKFDEIKKDTYGVFKYDEIPVVVFGNSCRKFFIKSEADIYLEWFKPLPQLKTGQVQIPPELDYPVWKYEYRNGLFIFKEIGY